MSDGFKQRTLARKNVKRLALSAAPALPNPAPSAGDSQIPGALGNDEGRNDTLEIGVEFKLDLRSEDLIVLKELGAGNGGTVSKVEHAATKVIMAKKVIHVEAKKEVRRNIVRELQVMHDCNSPHIVSFYGAFINDSGDVIMCMEYMDCGSLDRISRDFGPVRVDVLGKIAEAVLGGLTYLYNQFRIMHRDIKPSNILINSRGFIKLCDFGVSGELVNSIADTFVGTSTYMAPERIQGAKYSVKSDVWSVGLTLMELAIGRFPFDSSETAAGDRASAGPTGILDLLQQIVHEPAPSLPKSDAFPPILEDMIQKCLLKDPNLRPTPQELFDKEPFLQAAKRTPVDIEEWAISLMEKHNRKSHLAPQLSPSTQALLRGDDTTKDTSNAKTPTSGDIPIAGGDSLDAEVSNLMATNGVSASPSSQLSQGPSAPAVLPQMANLSLHGGHPPRTSSANALPGVSRLGSSSAPSNNVTTTTTIPARPVPPPGPLPAPPGSLQSTLRQQQQQSIYPNAADQEYREARRTQPSMYGGAYANGDAPAY